MWIDQYNFKLYNPTFELANGDSYEYSINDQVQDVPTYENNNALQTLVDNNQDTPLLKVTVKNKQIPSYNFEITKVDAETQEPLAGAQYKITGPGLPINGRYLTTDENGKASIKLNMAYMVKNNYGAILINNDKYDYLSEYTKPDRWLYDCVQ